MIKKMIQDRENTILFLKAELTIEIAEKIYNAMEARGMSQSDLARKLGKNREWVSRVLSGSENLTIESMVRIGLALDFFWNLGPEIAIPPVDDVDTIGRYLGKEAMK